MVKILGALALSLAVGCGKGEQHAINIDCDSRDAKVTNNGALMTGPSWCADTLDVFLREYPEVTIDDFTIYVRRIGDTDFASIVLLYRGDIPLKKRSTDTKP